MDDMEKLEKAIEGVQAKIQIQKAENQKLRNSLNEINMNKSNAMREVNRLKEVNISLENNIRETKEIIQQESSQENFNEFMDKLSGELFK